MAERQPIAFLSYVRSDDDHDDGRITAFRKRLEGEVRMQTGKPFAIFQDRNDIAWGQHWEDRINSSLLDVTFLIPVLTPSFFQSPACRSEFQTFSLKEKMLGANRLILPLYYVVCDQLGDSYQIGSDEIADVLRSRNWTDWRQFRFKPLTDETVAAALAQMAGMIKESTGELNVIGDLARAQPLSQPQQHQSIPGLPDVVPESEIPSSGEVGIVDEDPEAVLGIEDVPSFDPNDKVGSYHAYTKVFDEVIEAADLTEKAELLRLHKYVGSFSRALKKLHDSSLISLLSRFDPKRDVAPLFVSILIDNSGSMRGEKIIHTAAWCILIAEWMDRLSISTEILGYTTRAWKGGQSREAWLAAGKPSNPGRLNDLRHLIYKSFSQSISTSAPNFGVMAREGLLKENIDGEAILWAASRLQQQPSANKILFVISDGASVDDSTLSVNPANYLEKHLLVVIDATSTKLRLYAIGVGYDVSRYYPNAITLNNSSELGPRFFEALVNDPVFIRSFSSLRPKNRYRYAVPDDKE
jgi:cobaltochelatase CobT